MKKIIFIVTLLLLSIHARAGGSTGYVSLANPIQIIEEGADSRVFLYGITVNNGGCSNAVPVLLLNPSRIASEEIYSAILMAKASGKRVDLITNGCWFNNQYPIVISVYIE